MFNLVEEPQQLHDLLPKFLARPSSDWYKSDNYLVLDFENSFPPREDIVLAVWELGPGHPSYASEAPVVVWGSQLDQDLLLSHVEAADFIVCHNAKWELRWLQECGADLTTILPWCTQIAEYVRLGNLRKPLNLEAVARRYGLEGKDNLVSKLIKGGVCPSQIPSSLLERYCKQDVSLTHKLFLKEREVLDDLQLLSAVFTRNLVTPVLEDIERNGMSLQDCTSQLTQAQRRQTQLDGQLQELTGGINTNSPKQLGEYLYDTLGFEELTDYKGNPVRTEKGARKTGTEVIAQLRAKTPEQKEFKNLIIEAIKVEDKLDFFKKVKACCEENNGILQANINQTVTGTHRFSSTGALYKIQFQNIARDRKKYFTVRHDPEEWEVLEVDGSQLEFRTAAHLGRDQRAISDIWEGFDVHSFTASIIGVSRQDAKPHTFKPLYGGQSGPPKVQKYYKAFRDRYPGIAETQKQWTHHVAEHKQLRTEPGLIFYWPKCTWKPSGYIEYTTQIYNYPVQSLATAEIIPIAITYLWHYLKRLYPESCLTVNTVHDSIILEAKKELREQIAYLGTLCFTKRVYEYLKEVYDLEFVAPLGVGIKAGPAWNVGDELSIDVNPEYEIKVRSKKEIEEDKNNRWKRLVKISQDSLLKQLLTTLKTERPTTDLRSMETVAALA